MIIRIIRPLLRYTYNCYIHVLFIIYSYKTGLRLHSLFVFGILCSAVWWIKMGWAKTGSVFSRTIDVTRFRGITLTRLLFIKTEFYRTNMYWIIGCKLYFMVTRQLVDWTNEATLKLNIKWTFSCYFMHLYISLSILYVIKVLD